ncbi:MAG: YdcF family protein [Verrucomicrobia bacterium]|nr:YdcF family protein [Verrucomicrobiota bacterium]MBV8279763.1 YdcF family protein [Verrucomicrobiota bacterium]
MVRKVRFVQRRTILCPTRLGLCLLVALALSPVVWWFAFGEAFLSLTFRAPPQILVVEGWIGFEAIGGAKAEFDQHDYQYVIATGGVTAAEGWQKAGWSYAEGAANELVRLGVPREKIIVAPARETKSQRTFESAAAVWRALQSKGIQPRGLNVFTIGAHARRSRLVFSKTSDSPTQVGVISWTPPGYAGTSWWGSSDRARELVAETAGYIYEVMLNSGRGLNTLGKPQSNQVEGSMITAGNFWLPPFQCR